LQYLENKPENAENETANERGGHEKEPSPKIQPYSKIEQIL
jgi:hypothetical protein